MLAGFMDISKTSSKEKKKKAERGAWGSLG